MKQREIERGGAALDVFCSEVLGKFIPNEGNNFVFIGVFKRSCYTDWLNLVHFLLPCLTTLNEKKVKKELQILKLILKARKVSVTSLKVSPYRLI